MSIDKLQPGTIITGPLLPEPVEIIATNPLGTSIKIIEKGLKTISVREPVLSAAQLSQHTITPKLRQTINK